RNEKLTRGKSESLIAPQSSILLLLEGLLFTQNFMGCRLRRCLYDYFGSNYTNVKKSRWESILFRYIYKEYERVVGHSITKNQQAGIRACIERNSSDSNVFQGNDIFYSVYGKGNGYWGLR
ncbi:hypothetical protein ACTQ3L_06200, partial [Oscillospiraceae bacterium LCP25S3_E4]